ncbi:flippase [Pedobacter glucosidilyticus]|uniref:flippase n=1 Tax=Pedobacter glucosidilyticus TaxID=1122941 RepID=UPI000411400B|nr:flippase [Pedobacter glucosidilyticus]
MLEKFKNNYWIVSGTLNFLQNFSGVLFGFGSFFFLVRILSKNDFGVWTLFMSTTTILSVFRDGLLRSATIKFLASTNDKEEKGKIISSSFLLAIFITLIVLCLLLFLSDELASIFNAAELSYMLKIYALVFISNGLLMLFNFIEQANLKFKGVFLTNLITQGVFFAYILYCFFFHKSIGLTTLVMVQFVCSVLATILSYSLVKQYLYLSFQIFRNHLKSIFNYGKYAFGTSLSAILSNTVDQMMLGSMINPAAAAVYNIAVRILNLIEIPTGAVATIVFPQSSKRVETEGLVAVKYLYEKSVGTVLAILLPPLILIYCFTDLVIFLLAGEQYADSANLLRITLLIAIFMPFGRQFGVILDSIGKTKTTFYTVVVTTTLNLSLNYFLIKEIGVIGAAYATLIAMFLSFIWAQVLLRKILKVSLLKCFYYAYKFYPDFYKQYIKSYFSK